MLRDSNRTRLEDKMFDQDVTDAAFANCLLIRVAAKKKQFTKVDFKYTIFDSCYLRDCTFNSCDFTGCRFVSTNFHGSTFYGCTFDYAMFERTQIDEKILSSECPTRENIKARFARNLRMNYQQLGDASSVNKAMSVELQATETHLRKAWSSQESYYLKKYQSWRRAGALAEWISFKVLDVLWGNGESIAKLIRTIVTLLSCIALYSVLKFGNADSVHGYWRAMIEAPQVFLGTRVPPQMSHSALTVILASRLLVFGALVSIVVKRYSRR